MELQAESIHSLTVCTLFPQLMVLSHSANKDEDGNVVIEEHTETQPVLNPEWNAEQEYIPRKDRPEWAAVGVLGKLIVYDDGTLQSGDICRCGANGKAVKSIENGYTVLKRVADDKVLIWFKG